MTCFFGFDLDTVGESHGALDGEACNLCRGFAALLEMYLG